MKCHDQEMMLEDRVEIQKQITLEEAENPELENKKEDHDGFEGLGLTECAVKLFNDIHANEKRAATTRQGIMNKLAGYEEILEEWERYMSCRTSVTNFFQSLSGTHALPPVLLEIVSHNEDYSPRVQLSFVSYFILSCQFLK
jgi:hypothetical protein